MDSASLPRHLMHTVYGQWRRFWLAETPSQDFAVPGENVFSIISNAKVMHIYENTANFPSNGPWQESQVLFKVCQHKTDALLVSKLSTKQADVGTTQWEKTNWWKSTHAHHELIKYLIGRAQVAVVPVIGTWKRYKLGQARYTNWLKQTASKFKSSPSPPATIGTSKTKRIHAELDSTSEKVHWTELEGLAEVIVTNSKPEEIPWDLILVLRNVVAPRKKSARFYSKNAEEDTTGKLKASNQQHEHIIKVLEKVLDLLEKAVTPTRSKVNMKKEEPPQEHQRFSMDVLDNMFNLLQLHKPNSSPKGAVNPDEL
ncbi:hypothetical protein LZ30DRAFT_687556 [Colletotrichum cereale]|nr:hypothetical protein LZ30DRAFT_687556 [Colletotrichum cereale]